MEMEESVGMIFILIMMVFMVGIFLLSAWGVYSTSKKAGVSNAWLSFIPVLIWVPYLKTIKKSSWNVLWLFIPVVNLVFVTIWNVEHLKMFNQNTGWAVAYFFVPLFGLVHQVYMGMSSNVKYIG